MAGARGLQLCAVVVVLALGILLPGAEGTHFRYGTISWRPIQYDVIKHPDPNPDPEGEFAPGRNPVERNNWDCSMSGGTCKVEFTYVAAYRRDFHWGKYFREQYQEGPPFLLGTPNTSPWKDAGSCYDVDRCRAGWAAGTTAAVDDSLVLNFNLSVYATETPDVEAERYRNNMRIRMAAGKSYRAMGYIYFDDDTIQNTTEYASNPYDVTNPNAQVVEDLRYVCESPFETGDSPWCKQDDQQNQVYTPLFPRGDGARGKKTALGNPTCKYWYDPRDLEDPEKGNGTDCTPAKVPPVVYRNYNIPPSSRRYEADKVADYAEGRVPCETADNTDQADICAPWSSVYGFFFGDGEFAELVFEITEVSTDGYVIGDPASGAFYNTAMGNYVVGRARVEHVYPRAKKNGTEPWVAFFTGGNRLIRTTSYLRNNDQGRFRLEVSVNLNFPRTYLNQSPKLTSVPVLPIPYTGRGAESAYGITATFQVGAYDPDVASRKDFDNPNYPANEWVHYFIADAQKHGMLVSNQVPDLKYPSNWHRDDYELAVQKCYIASCGGLNPANYTDENGNPDEFTGWLSDYPGQCDSCTEKCATLRNEDVPDDMSEKLTNLTFKCEEFPEWDSDRNLAHPPPNMVVDVYTGQVYWETGVGPFENDTARYAYDVEINKNPYAGIMMDDYKPRWPEEYATKYHTKHTRLLYSGDTEPNPPLAPLEWGMYNVVFDVRSASHDVDCLEANGVSLKDECRDLADRDAPAHAYVSAPLDMLVYLYPRTSFCSKAMCGKPSSTEYDPNGLQTFRDISNYGDDFTNIPVESKNQNEKYPHAPQYGFISKADFTHGACALCGGALWSNDQVKFTANSYQQQNTSYCTQLPNAGESGDCDSSLVPDTGFCRENTRPRWVDQTTADDGLTPPVSESSNPFPGYAEVVGRRGEKLEFNLVAEDDGDCSEVHIRVLSIYLGSDFQRLTNQSDNTVVQEDTFVCTYDKSENMSPDWIAAKGIQKNAALSPNPEHLGQAMDCYASMFVWENQYTAMNIEDPVESAWRVTRKFTWNAFLLYDDGEILGQFTPENDPRPMFSVVCFEPYDNYEVGEKRCIKITLTSDKRIRWNDARPELELQFQDEECFPGTPFTPAPETTFYVAPGKTLKFTMTALQLTGGAPIDVYISQGGVRNAEGEVGVWDGATFEYNQTRVTEECKYLQQDPAVRVFEWTPKEGQQCEYFICFEARNQDGEMARTVKNLDGTALSPEGMMDERCYTIVVMDQSVHFAGGSYISAPPALLPTLTDDCGMSFGMWFLPETRLGTMGLATFGYFMPGQSPQTGTVVAQLWWEKASVAIFPGLESDDEKHTESWGGFNRLVFQSGDVELKTSHGKKFASDQWHFAMFTIDPLGTITMYLDGVELTHFASDMRDFHQFEVVEGSLPLTEGKAQLIGSILASKPGATGFLTIGTPPNEGLNTADFAGQITDVRVYSRSLSAVEVGEKMFAPLVPEEEIKLEAYYKFNDGTQSMNNQGLGNNALNQYNGSHQVYDTNLKFNVYRGSPTYLSKAEFVFTAGDTTGDNRKDSPLAPSLKEMDARGQTIEDLSGKGNDAEGCTVTECPGKNFELYFNWQPAPTMPPCPASVFPQVVHVDGGHTITVTGTGFAESQWLKCSFTMSDGDVKVVKATFNNDGEIECQNPGSPDLTVTAMEVTNGNQFSSLQIPVYEMERVIAFSNSTPGSVQISDSVGAFGTSMGANSIGAWILPENKEVDVARKDVITLSNEDGKMLKLQYVWKDADDATFVVAEFDSASSDGVELGRSSNVGAGWHYVMLAAPKLSESSSYSLYVDGEKFTVKRPQLELDATFVTLGGDSTGFVGYMEELTLWSTFLSQCEAYQLMWGNLTRMELCPEGSNGYGPTSWKTNLVAYLKFNDVADDRRVRDMSESKFDAVYTGGASFIASTVPFLAPSFNRKRPRYGPPTKAKDVDYDGEGEGYGVDFLPGTAPNNEWQENVTYPRGFQDYYNYVIFDEDGALESDSTLKMSVDGYKALKVFGFGFAQSKWLKCEFDGKMVPATYKSIREVECNIPPVDHPGKFSLGVMNFFPDAGFEDCNATVGIRSAQRFQDAQRLINYVPDVELKEVAVSMDGNRSYAVSASVSQKLVDGPDGFQGVTMGAWFKPDGDKLKWYSPKPSPEDPYDVQPILCFATDCATNATDELPITPSAVTAPYAQLCIVYKDQQVSLTSMLVDCNIADECYGSTYWGDNNESAPIADVDVGRWHYVEVTVDGTEINPSIQSELQERTSVFPSYKASMIVDGKTYDGSPMDFRFPLSTNAFNTGRFMLGGLGCPDAEKKYNMPAGYYTFKGTIDEVRVFKGVHNTNWLMRLSDTEVASEDLIGYYRMASNTPKPSQSLYSIKPTGPSIEDIGPHKNHLTFMKFEPLTSDVLEPTYEYVEVPWEAATTAGVLEDEFMLESESEVTVEGYNFVNSTWLKCVFAGASLSASQDVSFGEEVVVDATYISGTQVNCTLPNGTLPRLGFVQIANPRANNMAEITYIESALEFEGDKVKNSVIVGGMANEGETVDLQCSDGMRMDRVIFASYGRPKHGCNTYYQTECDGTETLMPCDYTQFAEHEDCRSDSGKPPFWTVDIVSKHCYGKSSCSIPASNDLFGDPCPDKYKWLQVAMRCSDRWTTKDYLQQDNVTSMLGRSGEYSIGLWVYPHSKPGVQAVASFGSSLDSEMQNRAVLQWQGNDAGTSGRFFYYDDCVYDVLPKNDDGLDVTVGTHQWYHIWLTRSASGTAKLYMNGVEAASWSTACVPDDEGSFFLGMDLNDVLQPKEYFDGLMDEVKIYNYSVGADMVQKSLTWSEPDKEDLVVYYRFNRDLGDVAMDESGNGLHGILAKSVNNAWNNSTLAWNTTDGVAGAVHTSYTFMGVPWYPTSVYALTVPGGATGGLVGGAEVTISGLNFANRHTHVLYKGSSIPSNYVDMKTMTATIPNIKDGAECAEGGTYELTAVNSGDTASGSMLEADVSYTQELGISDVQDGLLCYFPLLGDPGQTDNMVTVATDYSGNAYHGVVNGATEVANRNSYPAQALHFEEDDFIAIEECAGGKTVAMWISYGDADYPNNTVCQADDDSVIKHAWTHVVGVVDEGEVTRLFVNGEESTNLQVRDQVISVLVNNTIGGDGFKGQVDDLWIWNRELCDLEIVSLYYTHEFALEFGYGAEMQVPIASAVQGSRGLLAHYVALNQEHYEVRDFPTLSSSQTIQYKSNPYLKDFTATDSTDWSVELTGYIYAPVSAEFVFTITADSSFRLFINRGTFTLDDTDGSGADWEAIISEGSSSVRPQRAVAGNIDLSKGWYEIYMSYHKIGNQQHTWKLQWATMVGSTVSHQDVGPEISPKYLRAGTGPTSVEAWVWPYQVDGDHTIVSQEAEIDGLSGMAVGIHNGGFFASVYTGCECALPKCDEYREIISWKAAARANTWQHLHVQYDGVKWVLYVDGVEMDNNTRAYTNTRDIGSQLPRNPGSKFMAETRAPLVFGRENTQEVIRGSPSEIRQFYGKIHSFAKWGKIRAPSKKCPNDRMKELALPDLQVFLPMNEGVGLTAYTATGKGPTQQMYLDGVIDTSNVHSSRSLWHNETCSPYETAYALTKIGGTALVEATVGKCAVFTITSFDECGHMRMQGGDNYVVEVIGPLHLHAEVLRLEINNGITDNEDGSYSVNFTRTIAGYYAYKICVNNCDGVLSDGTNKTLEDGTKNNEGKFRPFFYPDVANSSMTYIYDDLDDALEIDEVKTAMAGVPVQFKVQTVDKFGNLRTSQDTDDIEVFFSGPYDFYADVEFDTDAGVYTASYTPEVSGNYQMSVRLNVFGDKQPVCTSGGYTCSGDYQSSYNYCTLKESPGDFGGDTCRFCVEVKEGSSMYLDGSTMPAVFPDSDALDLMDTPFTIFAFIKKALSSSSAPGSREYILSKMSEYSGKGYWLALLPTGVDGEYEMESGLYVGSENFRIAKKMVQLPTDAWTHIGITYTGTVLTMYVNQSMVESVVFADEPPRFNRANAQELKIGQGFAGMIDNVLIFKSVRTLEQFLPDNFCPHNVENNNDADLVAYYRFNEGEGVMTRDASSYKSTGVLGMVCEHAREWHVASLQCAPGYIITEVMNAAYGENYGTCGAFEAGACTKDFTEEIKSECLNKNNCTLRVSERDGGIFSVPDTDSCKGVAKSLAISAVCTPSSTKNLWEMDTAPTMVGTTSVTSDQLFCAFDLLDQGIGFEGEESSAPEYIKRRLQDLQAAGAQCGGAEMLGDAEAGKPVVFALKAKDVCNYRSVHGLDDFGAWLRYPSVVNVSAMASTPTCPDFPYTEELNDVEMVVHRGAMEPENNMSYCGSWGDLYVMEFTPEMAGSAMIKLEGQLRVESTMNVNVAPISAENTEVLGASASCEAGVECHFQLVAYDGSKNRIMAHGDAHKFDIVVANTTNATSRVEDSPEPGVYDVFITYAASGAFDLMVTLSGAPVYTGSMTASAPAVRPIDSLNITVPEARFEHTMVSYQDNLYVFGGARADKTYLDATLKLDLSLERETMYYNFKRMVSVDNMPESEFNVELHLNTQELIAAGKLKADCADLRFFTYNGEATLPMWVEPSNSPSGCGTSSTSVWIKVPGGMSDFWLYYGNMQAESVSDPLSVFGEMFEDFEYENSPMDNGWGFEDATSDACTADPGYNPGDPNSFYTSDVVSMTGSRALRADTAMDKAGGSLVKHVQMMKQFTMKVFMYDMMCKGAHFVSPDFKVCQPLDSASNVATPKTMLPNLDTGVGIHTASHNDSYCVLYPWHASTAQRELGWHSFTLRDNDEKLSIVYDEGTDREMELPLRADDITTDISKIFLRSAQLPDESKESSVFWDSILITAYEPSISCTAKSEMAVAYSPDAEWSTVGTQNPPPARQAHSAVVFEDGMYIFGGERSAYEYSDVWKYTFELDSWEYQAPANSFPGLGRHDHSAVVYGNTMYVYGGRSPAPLGDFWAYNFETNSWTPMPTSEAMMPRFGHAAAVGDGKMYVYGGFVSSPTGEGGLTDEIWEFTFEGTQWAKVGPRQDNYATSWNMDPTDAILFPQLIPTPRFAMSAVITGVEPALYVVGGAGGDSTMEEQGDLWRFDLGSKQWTLMSTGEDVSLLARYDGAAATISNGTRLVLYGGHAAGEYMSGALVMFVGETGL